MSNPAAARSKAWVCSSSLAGKGGSNPGTDMDVSVVTDVYVCQVEVGLITRPDESGRVRCVRK